jgi:hypothetical protein
MQREAKTHLLEKVRRRRRRQTAAGAPWGALFEWIYLFQLFQGTKAGAIRLTGKARWEATAEACFALSREKLDG